MTKGNDLINETRYKVDELVSESYPNHGLTKREYFAAMALQGLLSEQYWVIPECAAKCSIDMADALINALNDKPLNYGKETNGSKAIIKRYT